MLVGLTLEADASIGRSWVDNEPTHPLKEVEDVEAYIPKLTHLRCAYLLTVDSVRRQGVTLTHKHQTKKVDCTWTLKGEPLVVNQFHSFIL